MFSHWDSSVGTHTPPPSDYNHHPSSADRPPPVIDPALESSSATPAKPTSQPPQGGDSLSNLLNTENTDPLKRRPDNETNGISNPLSLGPDPSMPHRVEPYYHQMSSQRRHTYDHRPSPPPIATLPHSPSPSSSSLDRSSVSTPAPVGPGGPVRRNTDTPPVGPGHHHHHGSHPYYDHAPSRHTPNPYPPHRQDSYGSTGPGGYPPPGPRSTSGPGSPAPSYHHLSSHPRHDHNPPHHQQLPPPHHHSHHGGHNNGMYGHPLPYPIPPHHSTHAPQPAGAIVYTDDAATKLSDRVRRRCFNCCTTDTSTWRRSNLNPGKVLCNKCGLFERTHSRARPDQFPHKRGPLATSVLRNTPGHPIQGMSGHLGPPPLSQPGNGQPMTWMSTPGPVGDGSPAGHQGGSPHLPHLGQDNTLPPINSTTGPGVAPGSYGYPPLPGTSTPAAPNGSAGAPSPKGSPPLNGNSQDGEKTTLPNIGSWHDDRRYPPPPSLAHPNHHSHAQRSSHPSPSPSLGGGRSRGGSPGRDELMQTKEERRESLKA